MNSDTLPSETLTISQQELDEIVRARMRRIQCDRVLKHQKKYPEKANERYRKWYQSISEEKKKDLSEKRKIRYHQLKQKNLVAQDS
jgi:hypothetical protein